MRILVVQESDWLQKGPHQQHHLMEKLSLKGHEVMVIDFEVGWSQKPRKGLYAKRMLLNNVSKAYKDASVVIVRPSMLKLPLLDYASIIFTHTLEIYRQIVEFRPNVVVGFGILNTFIAMRISKLFRVPFVYYLIDALHTLIPLKELRFFGRVLESSTLRKSDVVCVINEGLRDYAVKLGARPEKVHVVRAGVDLKRFNPHLEGCPVREELGIDKDDVVLFFMGWLYRFSGLKELAYELAKIKDTYSRLRLVVVGEGEMYQELQRIRKECCLNELILTGWLPYAAIPNYIAMADVCLLPAYDNEVMRHIVPIKMYEYMACGKPVIATELSGLMREFGQGNGVIFVKRPEDVLKKAVELAEDKRELKDLGEKASNYVQKYSWEAITDQFERILKELAKK